MSDFWTRFKQRLGLAAPATEPAPPPRQPEPDPTAPVEDAAVDDAEAPADTVAEEALATHLERGGSSTDALLALPPMHRRDLVMLLVDDLEPGKLCGRKNDLFEQLLGQPLPFGATDLHRLIDCMEQHPRSSEQVLTQIEYHHAVYAQLPPELGARARAWAKHFLSTEHALLRERQRRIFAVAPDGFGAPAYGTDDSWGSSVDTWLETVPPDLRRTWLSTLEYAVSIGKATRPTRKWRDGVPDLPEDFGPTVRSWFEADHIDRVHPPRRALEDARFGLVEVNQMLFMGLVWMEVVRDSDGLAQILGSLAVRCFQEHTDGFPTAIHRPERAAPKVGLACILALGELGANEELRTLIPHVKSQKERSRLERILERSST